MHFLSDSIDQYICNHSADEPQILKDLNRETWQKVLNPRMLSGAYQGRLLSILSKLIAPKYVLEIGTYTGYSALCFAEGLQKDGLIHTIDHNEELEAIQNKYIEQSGYRNQIVQHIGQAADLIPSIDVPHYDLVFLDADKEQYPLYFDLFIDKVRPGGLILSDNVLWSGKVIETPGP